MTRIDPTLTAYGRPQAAVRTARSLEYEVFAQTTRNLARAWSARTSDHAAFVAAISDNTRLWTVLATDVADTANGLPQHLRAQLFYLFEFTITHSKKVLEGSVGAEALVDINTAVMRGLRGESSV